MVLVGMCVRLLTARFPPLLTPAQHRPICSHFIFTHHSARHAAGDGGGREPEDKWRYPDGKMTIKVGYQPPPRGGVALGSRNSGPVRPRRPSKTFASPSKRVRPFFIAAGYNRPQFACPKQLTGTCAPTWYSPQIRGCPTEHPPTRSVNYFELHAYDNIPNYDAGRGGPNGGAVNLATTRSCAEGERRIRETPG